MNNEERIDRETRAVIKLMNERWGTKDRPITDYNFNDNEMCELMDKDNKVVTTISERSLTNLWNEIEE